MEKIHIKIGQIINTFGHKGEVKVYPLTDNPMRFKKLKKALVETSKGLQTFTIEQARLHQKFAIIKFLEISNMNEAIELKNCYMMIPEEETVKLPEDNFYVYQLIGLHVYENEQCLGELVEVLETGSNDVYVVKNAQSKEILIPALKSVVKKINLDNKRIDVELPLGLLD